MDDYFDGYFTEDMIESQVLFFFMPQHFKTQFLTDPQKKENETPCLSWKWWNCHIMYGYKTLWLLSNLCLSGGPACIWGVGTWKISKTGLVLYETFYYMLRIHIHWNHYSYFVYVSCAVNHLDYLGVQVAWISGPWFLSIFINMLPWESGEILWRFDLWTCGEWIWIFAAFYNHGASYILSSSSCLGCASFWRESLNAISNSTCFDGSIW